MTPNKSQRPILISIVGSRDFMHRMTAASRRQKERFAAPLNFTTGNLAEVKSITLSEHPDVLLLDIGFSTTREDVIWLRNSLLDLRERFGKTIHIVVAATAPQKFAWAGALLFLSENSLEPSGIVDNFVISPPPGIPSAPSLEEQFQNCLDYVIELSAQGYPAEHSLPSLWEDCWVPSLCDPSSRSVWMRWLPRYAKYTNENPLIVGPTGTGKTRLAKAIHKLSHRKGPFVSITPRDFSSTELIQAELFGAVAGAYTGAVEKWGLVKKAEDGTLFIDELQSIDRDLQGKLITFIEDKRYRRVGEAEGHHANVRFIFATNRTLQDLVENGCLRDDFAYRLERLQINLDSLEKRRLDIAAGICFSLARVLRERTQEGFTAHRSQWDVMSSLEGITPKAYALLFRAYWPGNLRQLENTVAMLIELADIKGRRLIDEECTAEAMGTRLGGPSPDPSAVLEVTAGELALRLQTGDMLEIPACIAFFLEKARLRALEVSGGDIEQAALLIGDSVKQMELFASTRQSET